MVASSPIIVVLSFKDGPRTYKYPTPEGAVIFAWRWAVQQRISATVSCRGQVLFRIDGKNAADILEPPKRRLLKRKRM